MSNPSTIKHRNGATVCVLANDLPPEAFNSALVVLKKGFVCKYDPKTKAWIIPRFAREGVIEALSQVIPLEVDYKSLAASDKTEVMTELVSYRPKKIFDPSIMKMPPIAGKPPFENYQLEDITRAINQNRYGLFLDMGMGKTYIISAVLAHLRTLGIKKVVYITSNLGSLGVASEIAKFTHIPFSSMKTVSYLEALPSTEVKNPKLKAKREVEYAVKIKNREPFDAETDIVVFNYTSIRHIANHYANRGKPRSGKKTLTARTKNFDVFPIKEWMQDSGAVLVLDESHNLANPKSLQSLVIGAMLPYFNHRYLLSGTPADKTEKLYNQCRILDPALVGGKSYYDWLGEYAFMGTAVSAMMITGWKKDRVEALSKRMTERYCVYRKAKDCLNIEMPKDHDIYLRMSEPHRVIYEKFIQGTLSDIYTQHDKLEVNTVKNMFPYIVMALENPKLLGGDKYSDMFKGINEDIDQFRLEDHTKFNLLKEIVENKQVSGEKGIVWTVHPKTAEGLAEAFKDQHPLIINGNTPNDTRQQIIDDYTNDPKHKMLILSIQAANSSITVLAAKWAFYFERGFSFINYDQSTRRNVRIGQDRQTDIYNPVFEESLDVYFMRQLQNKNTLANKLLSKEFLSTEEWIKVFKQKVDED